MLTQYDWSPYKKREIQMKRQRRPCEDRDRDRSDASISQERGKRQKPEEARKGSSLELLRECVPADTLIPDFLSSEL